MGDRGFACGRVAMKPRASEDSRATKGQHPYADLGVSIYQRQRTSWPEFWRRGEEAGRGKDKPRSDAWTQLTYDPIGDASVGPRMYAISPPLQGRKPDERLIPHPAKTIEPLRASRWASPHPKATASPGNGNQEWSCLTFSKPSRRNRDRSGSGFCIGESCRAPKTIVYSDPAEIIPGSSAGVCCSAVPRPAKHHPLRCKLPNIA